MSERFSPLHESRDSVPGVESPEREGRKTFTDVHDVHGEPGPRPSPRRGTIVGAVANPGDAARLWTPEDAAGFLRITVKALYQMVYRREIPFLKIGRRLRFEEERLRAWLREKEVRT